MLIDACVSDDIYLIDGCGFAFVHTHFKVDGVILHIHFDRLDIEEQVTAVGIEFADRVIIVGQTVIEGLEVIYITGFDAQSSIQQFVRIDGVSHPFDRTDIVLVSFADRQIDIDARRVFGVRHHAVRHDICVAITIFVVFLNNRQFVFFVLFGYEFLGTEEVDDIVIVGLFHRLVNLAVCQRFITRDINLSDFGLGLLVDSNEHAHVTRMVGVVALQNFDIGVMVTFLGEVFLDNRLGVVFEVRRHLRALPDTCLYFYILFLAFLESFVAYFADTRPLLEGDDEPNLVAFDFLGFNLDAGEQALFPEPFDGFGYLVARHFNLISHSESGEADEHEVLVAVRSFH